VQQQMDQRNEVTLPTLSRPGSSGEHKSRQGGIAQEAKALGKAQGYQGRRLTWALFPVG